MKTSLYVDKECVDFLSKILARKKLKINQAMVVPKQSSIYRSRGTHIFLKTSTGVHLAEFDSERNLNLLQRVRWEQDYKQYCEEMLNDSEYYILSKIINVNFITKIRDDYYS